MKHLKLSNLVKTIKSFGWFKIEGRVIALNINCDSFFHQKFNPNETITDLNKMDEMSYSMIFSNHIQACPEDKPVILNLLNDLGWDHLKETISNI